MKDWITPNGLELPEKINPNSWIWVFLGVLVRLVWFNPSYSGCIPRNLHYVLIKYVLIIPFFQKYAEVEGYEVCSRNMKDWIIPNVLELLEKLNPNFWIWQTPLQILQCPWKNCWNPDTQVIHRPFLHILVSMMRLKLQDDEACVCKD